MATTPVVSTCCGSESRAPPQAVTVNLEMRAPSFPYSAPHSRLDKAARLAFAGAVTIRVLLADDHRIVREGLRALVSTLPGVEVIGESGEGHATLALALEHTPDVIVMDIGMPKLNGVEATRQILGHRPRIKIIGLSMHADARFIAEMLKAGASGYLLKDSAFEELAGAIRAVMAGQIYLSPGIAGVVVRDYLGHPANPRSQLPPELSHREREVLQLVAEGCSTKIIAAQLAISSKTADTHRQNIMKKLGLRSVAELTKYAVRAGLTNA